MLDQNMIDICVVVSIIVYNGIMTAVFLFRAYDKEVWERRMGLPFNFMLIPFTALWIMNLINGLNFARLGMSITVIIFLAYDFWYRTLTKAKPRHHPEKWPKELVIYVILLQLGSITLNGYGFLLSMQIGYLVLTTYFISLFAFAYYQYKYKKTTKDDPCLKIRL